MNWQPGNDFCVRFEDRARTPRGDDAFPQLLRRLSRIAGYYGFDLACFGSWNDMKELSRLEDTKHQATCPSSSEPAATPANGSRDYDVRWHIEIEATSPQDAAWQALAIQRDPESLATVFEITDTMTGEKTTIDLGYEE